MKTIGMVRNLDNLGRIVLPIELRKTFGIAVNDPVEIYTEGNTIILRKYAPGCLLCGEVTPTDVMVDGKRVCRKCAVKLIEALKGGGTV